MILSFIFQNYIAPGVEEPLVRYFVMKTLRLMLMANGNKSTRFHTTRLVPGLKGSFSSYFSHDFTALLENLFSFRKMCFFSFD